MTGLINLVSQYSSRLAIVPIVSFIMAAISIVIYFINKKRIVKFIPSLVVGALAVIIGIISITIFASNSGLNMAWIAIFLGSASIVGIIVCFLIELVVDIRSKVEDIESNDEKSSSKERVAKKRNFRKKSDKKEK
ncbi:MAG: hypothetical protein MRZ08_05915 [Anaerococcus sp.]|uniref:hypothetical protein n=1 Tax=Anaerococcus sp. TaxID=1872515 RepID=UPI00260654AC|nr:hypothetical protein [Anaerococcus sp.]MCI5972561.1 hypothetical protein [Anaerococcus sp.]MDD6919360.1 hypothetical protein [Peptoniphilaceae bacterium]MDY2928091.1 hypothetical protein [Anaerococcus sp.]